jgi:hypothetical protein
MMLSPRTAYNVVPTSVTLPVLCPFTTRTVYYDSSKSELTDVVTKNSTLYQKVNSGTWSRQDLAVTEKYFSGSHAPCYKYTSPGSCKFTTRTVGLAGGKFTESITVESNYYNWDATNGWWNITNHDLFSVARYKENSHAPCYGKASGTCKFTSRFFYSDKANSNLYVEWIFIGSKAYQYKSNSANSGYWVAFSDHDVAMMDKFKTSAYSPCYGISQTDTCKFDTALLYYDKDNNPIESYTIGNKFYNYSNGNWWTFSNTSPSNNLHETSYFTSSNGPCASY